MNSPGAPIKEPLPQSSPKGPQVDIRTKVSRLDKVGAQLIAITAVDLSDGNFELIYSFFSKSQLVNLRFTVADGYEIDSIADMFPGAKNFEREIIDLFGLKFKGIEGGLFIMPSANIVAPLRKSSSPETPRTRARRGLTDADH